MFWEHGARCEECDREVDGEKERPPNLYLQSFMCRELRQAVRMYFRGVNGMGYEVEGDEDEEEDGGVGVDEVFARVVRAVTAEEEEEDAVE